MARMQQKPKRINITHIAREAGVSISTISRVLNGKAGVTEKTRKKVTALLNKYHYVLDSHLSKDRKIAVLCGIPDFGDYQGNLLRGIFSYSTHNAMNAIMIFKDSAPNMTALEQIREQQCSGVIVDMPGIFAKDLRALADSELPIVLTDKCMDCQGMGWISHDSYNGERNAITYLLDLGHRHIGYLRHHVETGDHPLRFKAYEDVLTAAGIEPNPSWQIKTLPTPGMLQWENAYRRTKELLIRAPELTAIVATNDDLAVGIMKAVFDSGKKVPNDISIIGFDDYPSSAYLHPALTTVHHPIEEIGYLATEGLHLYFKNPNNKTLPRTTLPAELVIRESTCPPRKK